MSASFRVYLDADAQAKLDALAQEYVEEDVLPSIVKHAKRIVPVDTGELHNHISAKSDSSGNFVVADTEYAAFVEQGTSKMGAQPYLRPAMTNQLPQRGSGS